MIKSTWRFQFIQISQNGLVYTQTGTPYYVSLEVWQDKPYDHKTDIQSLGCVIYYEARALKQPFKTKDMDIFDASASLKQTRLQQTSIILNLRKQAKYYGILLTQKILKMIYKNYQMAITRKGLQANKSDNSLNQYNNNLIESNLKIQMIQYLQINLMKLYIKLIKQITQLEQKDIEKSSNVKQILISLLQNKQFKIISYSRQKIKINVLLTIQFNFFKKIYQRNKDLIFLYKNYYIINILKDRVEHQNQINSNYYAKDVIQSQINNIIHKSYQSSLVHKDNKDEEYYLRKNSSDERNSSNHFNRSKNDLAMLPSSKRPTVLMRIIEEHQQLLFIFYTQTTFYLQ
ncbi:unnamed protein product [Paramecium sonneborni]|uniref:non-specific serine/threonine protein kinase n=1 Tax=Paramecium sonneborni TaxID=65129 RepID=A0A8S1RM92_9CILI|nr:unnamed protein product [Paramecium sonneborni]